MSTPRYTMTRTQKYTQDFLNGPLLHKGARSHETASLLTQKQDEFLMYVESAGTLIYDLKRTDTVTGLVISFSTFFRSVTSHSVTGTVASIFLKLAEELSEELPFWQSSTSSWIDVLDDFHKNLHRVQTSPLGKKLISVFNHVIAHTFYFKMGIEVNGEIFHKIEKNYIKPTVWNCMSFADAIVALLLFLARAGRQALLTGSSDPFFVDSATISDWILRAKRLMKDAEFLGNPSAVGIETPTFLAELSSAISDGHLFCKAFSDTQKILVNGIIVELEMVHKRYISTMAAASFRFCPIGIFLLGDSGIGKSFITQGLFYHYASVRGLDKAHAVLYPRNPDDKYYSGFKSNMLGILYDDVAKHVSSKVLGIDQSLSDIISVINNIPLITNQADAPDKGKIPVLAEWVGITSNIEQLDVHAYYKNTYAVLRRLPYRIEPTVKLAFRKEGKTQLDATLIPQGILYPDCWTFHVTEVKRHDSQPLHGEYEKHGVTYECYADLLQWLTGVYEQHIVNQDNLMKTVNAVGPELLCSCRLPISLCVCDKASPPVVVDFPSQDGVVFGDFDAVPIAEAQVHNKDTADRMAAAVAVMRRIKARYANETGITKLYFDKWYTKSFGSWVVEYSQNIAEDTLEEWEESIDTEMKEFQQLPIRDKVFATSKLAGINVSSNDDYLTFVPAVGGKRNFLRSQLQGIYDRILYYVHFANWSDAQKAALEVYVYEHAPRYLAEGWDDDSLLRGAYDFVDANTERIAAGDKSVAELLRSPTCDIVTTKDRFCRFLGIQYFTRPWFRSTVNYAATTRLGEKIASRIQLSPAVRVDQLARAARWYDHSLMGTNTLVLLIVTIGSSVMVVAMVKFALRYFSSPDAQLDLNTIGRKPVKREDEAVNVWRVQERNITALDFHPRRPNTLAQMLPGIRFNSVYMEFSAAECRGTTRGLVIDNNTIVMNYHSYYANMVLKVYVGKKTTEGVQPCFVINVDPEMVRHIPGRDLAVITTSALPAMFKNISAYLPKKTFSSVGPAFYYIPQSSGGVKEIVVTGVRQERLQEFKGSRGDVDMQSWMGTPNQATVGGDCGSPLIIQTPYGPVIAGIHCAFNASRNVTHAAPIFFEDFEIGPMVEIGEVLPKAPLAQVALTKEDKLYSDYHQSGQLIVFGALKGFRPRPKANGRHTLIAPFLLSRGPDQGLAITDRLTTPDMGSWAPQQNILKEYLHPTHSMREKFLLLCCESFSNHITENLTTEDVGDVHVVPLSVAVNGFPGIPNVDAQKFTTSAGHGFPGPKMKYVTQTEEFEEWPTFKEYGPEVQAEIVKIYELALQGIRSHPIFTAQLKDEMISLAKRAAKKTRGFYMCPVAFLTVMRMFTTGLTRVMVRRRDLFRTAVGLNTHSEQWNDLYEDSQRIPGNNWMAGDFKGFDKILSILLQNGAKSVLLELAKFCGFTPQELLALDVLLCDNVNAVIDFFGMLVMLLGGEVSGHQLTTFFNSICNILLHLYAWAVLADEQGFDVQDSLRTFWILVFIRVLGDDIMAKIHPSAGWYNHTTVQRVFAAIGIEYTMADKTSVSVPYISCSQVGFLKRSFRTHEAFPGMMVAPLDVESIYKMLVYTQPSKAITEEEQLAMAICSAKSEAFFHGSQFYHNLSNLIDAAPKTPELLARMEQFPAPTWNQMYERFLLASPKYRVLLVVPGLKAETAPTQSDSYCQENAPHAQSSWRMDRFGSTTMECSSEESEATGVRLSPKKHVRRHRVEKNRDVEILHLSKTLTNTTQQSITTEFGQMASSVVESAIKNTKAKVRRRAKSRKWDARPVAQADIRPDTAGNVTQVQQNYEFKDEPTSVTVDMSTRSTSIAKKMTMPQSLGEYFARPFLIDSFVWTEALATGVVRTFNPWDDFLSDPSFKEKTGGYGLIRGNLHIKHTVNGNPFLYGGLISAYTPLSGYRTDTVSSLSNLALVQHSQKPHVWLNPQNTSSAEMVLPFLYPYPMMETKAANYRDMGKLDYVIYSPLKSANGLTGQSVDVHTFAWLEDVELGGPTNQPVAQSNVEYTANGQISGPASTIANAAGKLSDVPIIGPYATATSKMVGAIGKAASLFGFTNVPNVRDIEPVKQMPFSLSSTEISTPVVKLSMDPKQETALGASQHGGSTSDELTLKRFASRSAFLVGSDWLTSQAPAELLFSSLVSPQLWQSDGSTQMVLPPCAYVSQPFQWWRGSVKFTFKMIRSKYHRGRVQISWDQAATTLNQGGSMGNVNTFSTIMDLDETDEVTVVVPYVQNRLFLNNTLRNANSPVWWSTDTSPPVVGAVGSVNGVISVRVLNRLTAPEASSNITMLVYISGGDDLEFAGPRDMGGLNSATNMKTLSSLTTAVAQSNVTYDVACDDSEQQASTSDPMVYMETFGEVVTSLRTVMHRSALVKSYVFGDANGGISRYTIPLKHMPPSPGVWNNGIDNFTVSALPVFGNINQQHLIPYIASCFIGSKGSVNVNANVKMGGGGLLAGFVDQLQMYRVTDGRNLASASRRPFTTLSASTDGLNTKTFYHNNVQTGFSGMALTNTRTNTGLAVNLPYYSQGGFHVVDLYKTYNNRDAFSGANEDWWNLVVQTPTSDAAPSFDTTVDVYYATGPDYDLIFFINTPTLYLRVYAL